MPQDLINSNGALLLVQGGHYNGQKKNKSDGGAVLVQRGLCGIKVLRSDMKLKLKRWSIKGRETKYTTRTGSTAVLREERVQ